MIVMYISTLTFDDFIEIEIYLEDYEEEVPKVIPKKAPPAPVKTKESEEAPPEKPKVTVE